MGRIRKSIYLVKRSGKLIGISLCVEEVAKSPKVMNETTAERKGKSIARGRPGSDGSSEVLDLTHFFAEPVGTASVVIFATPNHVEIIEFSDFRPILV